MALTNLQANLTLDVYNHDGTRPSIKTIALDDNTRYVLANIRNRGEIYDIGSEAAVQLIVIRPDKVGVQVTGQSHQIVIGVEDDTPVTVYGAYAELDQPAIAIAGTLLGQFKITSGDQILRTQVFQIYNGEALDADEWADEYDGYNLEEMATSIETNTADIATLEADVSQIKEDLSDMTSVKDTDAENGIFDFADKQGHVVMRLEAGMIRTCANAVGYHVVTVKPSGGDFSSLRSAVESIADADARLNPYVIEVYEGTYNVLADYTDTEIRASGFSGLVIGDGINIRGIGNRDNIVIHGELSTTDYDSTLRNEVSTLNLVNEMWMENVTVTATNIRYCVHDDLPPTRPYYTRHVKNCKFRIVNATSGTQQKAWGEGSRQGKTTILEDCDFGTCMLWHSDNTGSATRAGKLIVKNCTAMMALINCKNHSVLHQVYLYNNNFALISHSFTDGSTSNKMMQVTGTGNGAMTNAPSDWNYVNGDIERFRTNGTLTLSNGQLVIPSTTPYWVSGTLAKATDPVVAYGVVVGQDSDFFYVQHSGYINVDRFGFSGLVIGDKITVKSDGTLEVNGTGETFGIVCCVTNDYGTYMRRVA